MKRAEAALAWLARRGLLVLILGLVAAGYLLQLSASPVLTASMTPTFRPGDAVLTRTEPLTDLRVGQVALLVPPGQVATFAHRIVSITGDPAHPTVRTQGDANAQPDPWTVRPTEPSVRQVLGSVPRAGRLVLLTRGAAGRALLTALFGLVLTAFACRQILLAGDPPDPPLGALPR